VNWTSGNLGGFGGPGITFTNNGTFNAGPSGNNFFSGNSSNNTFANNGTFNKTGSVTVTFSGCAFNNIGSLNLNAGSIVLSSGGNLGGTIVLAPATFFDTNGGTFNNTNGSISGSGTARFQGGTHNMVGTLNLNTLTSIDNATFTGAGNVNINQLTDWNSGTMSGTGTTTVANGVILTMSTTSTRTLSRPLVNNGRINHSAGSLFFGGGGTLTNNATKVYELTGNTFLSNTGTNTFSNAGIFNDHSTNDQTFGFIFNNSGQFNIFGTTVRVDGGGTNTGARNLAAGTILHYRANYTHGAGSTSAGSGILSFNGGTQTISGNWTSTSFVQMLTGILDGAGNLTTNGPFSWASGTVTGVGNITVGPAGKLALTTTSSHTLSRPIVNNGNLHFLNGQLTVIGTTITNNASGTFAVLPSATITVAGGINAVNNAGLFKKMGPDTITFDSALGGVRMNNTGTVDVRNGTLNLNGPITQLSGTNLTGGTWQILPTATLGFGASNIRTVGAGTVINLVGTGGFAPLAVFTTNNGTINLTLGGIFQCTPFQGTFTNNGIIDLGADRWFKVNGNFTQGAAGKINLDLFSITRYSHVLATGAANLNGTAAFQLVGGFVPTPGMVFNFFQSGSRTGTFSTTTIPSFAGGSGSVSYINLGANLVIS
jgi:hypothetical protein